MEEKIPLFPLKMVPFPGEEINLHIFEPRYKDLVNDILDVEKRFGIPPFIHKKIDFGTLMEITKVVKVYDDGRMDIITNGIRVFKILDYKNPAGKKKYAEGFVEYLENDPTEDPLMKSIFIEKIEEFFTLINELGKIQIEENVKSFDVIHKLGLTLEMEYEILKMEREVERQEYIIDYLDQTIPVLQRVEKAKKIIRLNGHFRYFDAINF
jgi:Lon protease-like protein